jgi:uncharacterized protein YcaQ
MGFASAQPILSAQAMKRIRLEDMNVDQLVERFAAIALAQHEAINMEDNAKYKRLFDQMTDMMAEFLTRPIEQRRALMALYEHPNPQVRYTPAFITRDFAPQAARRVCEIISERNEYPQAADARGMIRELDEGRIDMSWILNKRR